MPEETVTPDQDAVVAADPVHDTLTEIETPPAPETVEAATKAPRAKQKAALLTSVQEANMRVYGRKEG